MVIRQGDLYWVQSPQTPPNQLEMTQEAGSSARASVIASVTHPHVVIQTNDRNQDPEIETVTLCALTTNAKKISVPGNVLLAVGEANLTRPSMVEVSKIITMPKSQLGQYIGTLSPRRMEQISAGIQLVERSYRRRSVE